MSDPSCPKCGFRLMRVIYPRNSYLSRDQFESVKAGDWYCTRCRDETTKMLCTYFWDKDLVPDKGKLAPAGVEATGTEARVCQDIAQRQTDGLLKYGVPVESNPLPLRQWLQHAYEETLDQAIYLRRAMDEMDAKGQP